MIQKLRTLYEKSVIYRVFVKKYKRYFLFGTLSLIAVDIINIFPPLIIKKTIDILPNETDLTRIATLAGLFLLVSLCQGVCRYLWRMFFIGTSFRCDYDLRLAFFEHIETLSQKFFQKYKTGDLMSRATNDIGAVRMAVGPGLLIGLDAVFYFFVIPPIIISLSPRLSFYTFLLMPLTPFIAYTIKNIIDRRFRAVQENFSRISEKVQENISGIRVVKSFNMSRQEESRFLGLGTDFVKEKSETRHSPIPPGAYVRIYYLYGHYYFTLHWRKDGHRRDNYPRHPRGIPAVYRYDGLANDGHWVVFIASAARQSLYETY